MSEEKRVFTGRMDVAGCMGPLWLVGWLFTLGFLHLGLPKALYALVIWPYYLGVHWGR